MIKKANSNYLKLFLVFLVIFGLIGNIFAGLNAPSTTSNSNSINNVTPSGTPTEDPFKITPITITFNSKDQPIYSEKLKSPSYTINSYSEYIEFMKNYGNKYCTIKNSCNIPNNIYVTNSDTQTEYNNIKNNCLNNPLTCPTYQLNGFLLNNDKPSLEGWTTVYTQLPKLNEDYTKAQKDYSDTCSANPKLDGCNGKKTTMDNAKVALDNINNLIRTQGDINSALTAMNEEQRKIFLENYNKNKCGEGWTSSICKMFNQETAESLAVQDYNKKIQILEKGNIDSINQKSLFDAKIKLDNCQKDKTKTDCSTEQTKYLNEYNQELLKLALKGLDGYTLACDNGIDQNCINAFNIQMDDICKNSPDQCESYKLASAKLKTGYKATQVETNIGFDILTAILSPDPNAIKAAKMFGFEADYSNVPKFLSESIPSQICLAKIDGYLDKTKQNSVNGQGGLTSYGCSQEYTQVYDEETKKYKKMPQTQCLEVLADLRAQRTQVTPDGKTFISYSYYIKAPPSTELKYIVAISYLEGNTIKKKTIIPLTKTNGIKNGFDSVELQLNSSLDNINENSFTINLLAIYSNNKVYQKLSYPIKPIVTGDSYSAPIPGKVSSSNQNGASSGASQNAELSTDDMLAMI